MGESFRIMRTPPLQIALAAVFLCWMTPSTEAATIIGNFTGGTGTTNASHQFEGTAGEGWNGGWVTSTTNATMTPTVTNTNPIYGTDNYLHVNIDAGTSSSRRSSLRRDFNSSTLGSSSYKISFTLRMDDLTGYSSSGDYFGIFASPFNNPTATAAANQTWGMYAQGDGNITLSSGPGDGGTPITVNTGIALATGKTYTFDITVNPGTNTWVAKISDGTTSFTSEALGFRTNGNDGHILHVNTLMSGSTDDWTYSLSGVTITTVPEPSSVALLGAGAVCAALLGRRR